MCWFQVAMNNVDVFCSRNKEISVLASELSGLDSTPPNCVFSVAHRGSATAFKNKALMIAIL
jgi:hypothetical protein